MPASVTTLTRVASKFFTENSLVLTLAVISVSLERAVSELGAAMRSSSWTWRTLVTLRTRSTTCARTASVGVSPVSSTIWL